MTLLETDRLTLRQLTAADIENVHRLDSDPEVMRYIIPCRTREESEKYLTDLIADYATQPGLGRWAIIERATGAFTGIGVLKSLDNTPDIEVGYRFFPPYWGRGYATEVTRALLRHAFGNLQLPQVVGVTDPRNLPSQRVLEKCGLRFQRLAYHYGGPVRLYALDNPGPAGPQSPAD